MKFSIILIAIFCFTKHSLQNPHGFKSRGGAETVIVKEVHVPVAYPVHTNAENHKSLEFSIGLNKGHHHHRPLHHALGGVISHVKNKIHSHKVHPGYSGHGKSHAFDVNAQGNVGHSHGYANNHGFDSNSQGSYEGNVHKTFGIGIHSQDGHNYNNRPIYPENRPSVHIQPTYPQIPVSHKPTPSVHVIQTSVPLQPPPVQQPSYNNNHGYSHNTDQHSGVSGSFGFSANHNQNAHSGSGGGSSSHGHGVNLNHNYGGSDNQNSNLNSGGGFAINTDSLGSGYSSNAHGTNDFNNNHRGNSNSNNNAHREGHGSYNHNANNHNSNDNNNGANWSSLDQVGLNLNNLFGNSANSFAVSSAGTSGINKGFSSASASSSSSASSQGNGGASIASASASASSSSFQSELKPSYG